MKTVSELSNVFPHLDYKPKLPQRTDHGIGIVGAGGIVNYAHLPAYKKAGFKVAGITDRNREQAERTAKDHGIGKVYASVDELLRQPEIEIIDSSGCVGSSTK
jgi:shikimate 5-dehydrogenase